MKTAKKLCALILSFVLMFACFAVIPFAGITAAAAGTTYVAKLNYTTADTWTYMQTEIPLATGTYQFDVDYYKTGSVTQRVRIDANPGTTEIDRTDDGSHITVQFYWVYNGSTAFNLQLRDDGFTGTGTVYFANPVLKAVTNGVLTGDNQVWDFSKQYSDVGATITTDYGWRGKWQRTNTSAGATFTVETDSAGHFTVPNNLATTATKHAVFIGKTGSAKQAANVFFPLSVKYPYKTSSSNGPKLADGVVVEFSCKVKMISGTKPIVGFLRLDTNGKSQSNYQTVQSETGWVDNSSSTLVGDVFTVRLTLSNIPGDGNTYSSETRSSDGDNVDVSRASGGNWGAITIGNVEHNNHWTDSKDYNVSFIMSDPSLRIVQTCNGEGNQAYDGTNFLPDFGTNNPNGVYGLAGTWKVGSGTNAMNHHMKAPTQKWALDTQNPSLVKFVKVDNSFSVARRTYVYHAATSTTREYYTCDAFSGVKFEKYGTGCFNVISNDINKKAVIIGSDGANKVANIYLPMYTHRYFSCIGVNDGNLDLRDGYTSNNGGDLFLRISFNAKRLSGSGQPVVGRLYGYSDIANYAGELRADPSAAYNGSGDATAQEGSCTSSYNASTGAYTATVRVEKGHFRQTTENGYNEFLTIGNVEHAASGFDTDSRGSSFAITDISIQVYDSDNTTLLDAEAAPQMVAGNYWFDPDPTSVDDFSSQHLFESEGTKNHNGRKTGLFYAPVDTWCCDGSQAMISVVDRSDCLAHNHTLDYHAATSTKMEYWSCSTCRASYADPYASEPVGNDVNAVNKMILVEASGSQGVNALLPLCINSSAGTHYYKFTCDMLVSDGATAPTISVLQGSWWGGNGAISTDGWSNNSSTPSNNLYATYNATTHKYEAVIKIEHSSSTLAYSNALTGAYAAILLGNVRHVGAGGSTDTKYNTAFAFSNPQLYELTSASNPNSTTGSNLAAPVTDKTLNFSTNYVGTTTARGNENTMSHPNNPLAAPLGKWSIDGFANWITTAEIPDGYFDTEDSRVSFKSHSLVLTGEIGVNFFMDLSGLSAAEKESSHMVFAVTNAKGDLTDEFDAGFTDLGGNGYYGFTCFLSSVQMADLIVPTFYIGDNIAAIGVPYSVKNYIDYVALNSSDTSLVTLVKALGDYGHYAQGYLGNLHSTLHFTDINKYRASDYSASDYSSRLAALSDKAMTKSISGTAVSKVSYNLNFDSGTYINVKMTASEPITASATVDGKTLNASSEGNFRTPGLPISILGDAFTLSGNGTANTNTFTVTLSGLSYIRAILNSSTSSTAAKNAMAALYDYYNAAVAYAG